MKLLRMLAAALIGLIFGVLAGFVLGELARPENMARSNYAQWFGAIGTIAAVIVALFKDPILAWWRQPRLIATCTREIPWTVRTPMNVFVSNSNSPQSPIVVWSGDCYFVRVKVENNGKTRAEKVQVSAQKLGRRGADHRFVEIPTILPLNLRWANIGVPILDGISPKMSSFCDVISFCDPGNQYQRRPQGIQPNVTVAQLQLEVDPLTDTHLLAPGAYQLTVRIAAANVKPSDYIIEFLHNGGWMLDDDIMRRDCLGVSLRGL